MIDQLIHLDKQLLLWLNQHHSPFFDRVMWFISGKTEWIPLYILIAAYLIYRFRWKSIFILLGVSIAITLADQTSVKLFKEVFCRLRPTHDPEIQAMVHIVNGYKGGLYGFVSSHAANTFALATYLSLVLRIKAFTWLIFSWAAVVSYSRIYLGVHFPADILGGAILGTACGIVPYIVVQLLDRKFQWNILKN